eukprot:jgi/Bigna1/128754/aug1.7_g3462
MASKDSRERPLGLVFDLTTGPPSDGLILGERAIVMVPVKGRRGFLTLSKIVEGKETPVSMIFGGLERKEEIVIPSDAWLGCSEGEYTLRFDTCKEVGFDSAFMSKIEFYSTRKRGFGVQLSALKLYSMNGSEIPVKSTENPKGSCPAHESVAKLVDGDVKTKWFDRSIDWLGMTTVVIDLKDCCESLGEYEIFTANDMPQRDPITWTVAGRATDKSPWLLLHSALDQSPMDCPTERYSSYGRYKLLLEGMAIGKSHPVKEEMGVMMPQHGDAAPATNSPPPVFYGEERVTEPWIMSFNEQITPSLLEDEKNVSEATRHLLSALFRSSSKKKEEECGDAHNGDGAATNVRSSDTTNTSSTISIVDKLFKALAASRPIIPVGMTLPSEEKGREEKKPLSVEKQPHDDPTEQQLEGRRVGTGVLSHAVLHAHPTLLRIHDRHFVCGGLTTPNAVVGLRFLKGGGEGGREKESEGKSENVLLPNVTAERIGGEITVEAALPIDVCKSGGCSYGSSLFLAGGYVPDSNCSSASMVSPSLSNPSTHFVRFDAWNGCWERLPDLPVEISANYLQDGKRVKRRTTEGGGVVMGAVSGSIAVYSGDGAAAGIAAALFDFETGAWRMIKDIKGREDNAGIGGGAASERPRFVEGQTLGVFHRHSLWLVGAATAGEEMKGEEGCGWPLSSLHELRLDVKEEHFGATFSHSKGVKLEAKGRIARCFAAASPSPCARSHIWGISPLEGILRGRGRDEGKKQTKASTTSRPDTSPAALGANQDGSNGDEKSHDAIYREPVADTASSPPIPKLKEGDTVRVLVTGDIASFFLNGRLVATIEGVPPPVASEALLPTVFLEHKTDAVEIDQVKTIIGATGRWQKRGRVKHAAICVIPDKCQLVVHGGLFEEGDVAASRRQSIGGGERTTTILEDAFVVDLSMMRKSWQRVKLLPSSSSNNNNNGSTTHLTGMRRFGHSLGYDPYLKALLLVEVLAVCMEGGSGMEELEQPESKEKHRKDRNETGMRKREKNMSSSSSSSNSSSSSSSSFVGEAGKWEILRPQTTAPFSVGPTSSSSSNGQLLALSSSSSSSPSCSASSSSPSFYILKSGGCEAGGGGGGDADGKIPSSSSYLLSFTPTGLKHELRIVNLPDHQRATSSVYKNERLGLGHNSLDGVTFTPYRHLQPSGRAKEGGGNSDSEDEKREQYHVFEANTDRATLVSCMFHRPILCRFVRIHPRGYHSHISMRAALLELASGVSSGDGKDHSNTFDAPTVVIATGEAQERGEKAKVEEKDDKSQKAKKEGQEDKKDDGKSNGDNTPPSRPPEQKGNKEEGKASTDSSADLGVEHEKEQGAHASTHDDEKEKREDADGKKSQNHSGDGNDGEGKGEENPGKEGTTADKDDSKKDTAEQTLKKQQPEQEKKQAQKKQQQQPAHEKPSGTAVLPAAVVANVSSEWSCPVCTFANRAKDNKCVICQVGVRPPPAAASSVVTAAAADDNNSTPHKQQADDGQAKTDDGADKKGKEAKAGGGGGRGEGKDKGIENIHKASAAPNNWTCLVCTFSNDDVARKTCAMCNSPRPVIAEESVGNDGGGSGPPPNANPSPPQQHQQHQQPSDEKGKHAVAPELARAPSALTGWYCDKCTMFNKNDRTKCEVCGLGEKPSVDETRGVERWQCLKCTVINPGNLSLCKVCSSPSPKELKRRREEEEKLQLQREQKRLERIRAEAKIVEAESQVAKTFTARSHARAAVTASGMLVLYGGIGLSGEVLGDLWALDLHAAIPEWRQISTMGQRPSPCWGCVFQSIGHSVWLFGGALTKDGDAVSDQLFELQIVRSSDEEKKGGGEGRGSKAVKAVKLLQGLWCAHTSGNNPKARYSAAYTALQDNLFVFGGKLGPGGGGGGGGISNELLRFDIKRRRWLTVLCLEGLVAYRYSLPLIPPIPQTPEAESKILAMIRDVIASETGQAVAAAGDDSSEDIPINACWSSSSSSSRSGNNGDRKASSGFFSRMLTMAKNFVVGVGDGKEEYHSREGVTEWKWYAIGGEGPLNLAAAASFGKQGAAACEHARVLYVFGGLVSEKDPLHEVWVFSLRSRIWQSVTQTGEKPPFPFGVAASLGPAASAAAVSSDQTGGVQHHIAALPFAVWTFGGCATGGEPHNQLHEMLIVFDRKEQEIRRVHWVFHRHRDDAAAQPPPSPRFGASIVFYPDVARAAQIPPCKPQSSSSSTSGPSWDPHRTPKALGLSSENRVVAMSADAPAPRQREWHTVVAARTVWRPQTGMHRYVYRTNAKGKKGKEDSEKRVSRELISQQ